MAASGSTSCFAGEIGQARVEVGVAGDGLAPHGVVAVFQAQRGFAVGEKAGGDGGAARPDVFGEREIAVDERNLCGIEREKALIHHAMKFGAIGALEIFVDDDAHGAIGEAFDGGLLGEHGERGKD